MLFFGLITKENLVLHGFVFLTFKFIKHLWKRLKMHIFVYLTTKTCEL